MELQPAKTITISMPPSLREFVEAQVKEGGYGNVSEYFRSLVRGDQERLKMAALEEALLRGLQEGGEGLEVGPDFWQELRSEAIDLAKKRK